MMDEPETVKVFELTQLQAIYLVSMLQANRIESGYFQASCNNGDGVWTYTVRAVNPGDAQGFSWVKGMMSGFKSGVIYCQQVKEEASKL